MKKSLISLINLFVFLNSNAQDTLSVELFKNLNNDKAKNVKQAKIAIYYTKNENLIFSRYVYSLENKSVISSQHFTKDSEPIGDWVCPESSFNYDFELKYFDKNVDTIPKYFDNKNINDFLLHTSAELSDKSFTFSDIFTFPCYAKEMEIFGTVKVWFIINEDGTTSNHRVLKSVDRLIDKDAVRIAMKSPKFIPAKYNGEFIKSTYVLTLNYEL